MSNDPLSDLNSFYQTGFNSKLIVLEGVDAVKNLILNLLGTTPGDILFEPTYGSYIQQQLFEPLDSFTAFEIKVWLQDAVIRWLPFVVIDMGSTSIIPDTSIQGYRATIVFSIAGTDQQGILQTNITNG